MHSIARNYNVAAIVLVAILPSMASAAAAEIDAESPIFARNGLAVSASPDASRAAIEIMKDGGNAFDAAASAAFVLAVSYPLGGNIAGGGFAVGHTEAGDLFSLDFREKAPQAAHTDMFLDAAGEAIPGLSTRSILASGVPGSIDGYLRLWEDHGSGAISLPRLLRPAIRLARKGATLGPWLAEELNKEVERFKRQPAARATFIRSDGQPWQAGDVLRQPGLAKSLKRIARHGRAGFYAGETAERIAAYMSDAGGVITLEDLRGYRAQYREPVTGEFHGYTIASMGPPSSGGIALVQMLNMFDALDATGAPWGSAWYIHSLTEIQRRVYADRAAYIGDPAFADVPVYALIAKQYAAERVLDIQPAKATRSEDVAAGDIFALESSETTHLSVIDARGNAIALTTSLNGPFGSGHVVPGTGILLNNHMNDFATRPDQPNRWGIVAGKINAAGPEKRMTSSMTPTIVLRDGQPVMVLGTPGGGTIPTTVLQIFLNVALHGMNIREAVNAPRHHSQWWPDEISYEPGATTAETAAQLEEMGHTLRLRTSTIGAAHCILIDAQGYYGSLDPRRQAAAVGY